MIGYRTAAAVLGLLMVALQVHAQPPGAAVVVDEARLEPVEQFREVVGELRALRRALLATEEEGLVVELGLEEGDSVLAGQVIARLRDHRAELEVSRAQADLAARRASLAERTADLERARRDLARVDELQVRGSAAQAELEDRRTALAVSEARVDHARAEVAAAEAMLQLAGDRLARLSVTAPFAGTVAVRRTEVGQWVRQGEAILELVALDQLEARLHVPEALVPRLRGSAESVRVRISATGQAIAAPIAGIIPDADPLSRLVPVRLRLDNPDHDLRPGMSIAGLIATGTREPTLTVHKDAILRDDAGEFVYINVGGAAAVARIQSLFPLGERIAVRSASLHPGAQVVVEGNERLFPTQPLKVTGTRPGPAAGIEAAPPQRSPHAGTNGEGR
jgi:membrane fusion protein, multidrug efflux system